MNKRLRVLVVEDNLADVDLIREYLSVSEFVNFRIDSVARLSEALARLEGESYDLLLIDLGLPDSRGLETFLKLRKAAPETPMIILTGHDDAKTAITAVQNGAQDYLIKGELVGNLLIRAAQYAVERKRAEEELRESYERFSRLANSITDVFFAFDKDLRYTYWNAASEELTKIAAHEAIGKSLYEIFPDTPETQRAEKIYRETLTTGLAQTFINHYKIGGKDIIFEISTYPSGDGISVFSKDISKRRQMEDALRQAEGNFRRSIDDSPMGVRIVSAEGETLYANRAILDIYGYDDIEEFRSIPVKARYAQESYAEYQLRKKTRMNSELYPNEYEISIVRKTGEIRHLKVFRKEIFWDNQTHFQTIYNDITEQKKAEEKLIQTLSRLQKAVGGIFQVLSLTTEKRDPYTAGHQRRVAELARAIGQEMGLPQERLEGLSLAGIVHDVGKVSIPAEILSKPGSLTKIEYNLIKGHSQSGHDILGDIDFSWPIAEIVLQHHERLNGSGYPRGLKGDDILLEARILAVSDVVEAMVSHRPYRPALGIAAAIEELDRNKFVLYDPEVVAMCLKLFRENNFQFTA
jgi:PAS domain S-box-containing protein